MTKESIEKIGTIRETALGQALGERYLSYALSTIVSRSLPDVRDGLKPVHRRILYAMWEAGNTSKKPCQKSSAGVGYVMMRYHPHGNDAIYDAMVRMAQDFSMRYQMIDGQGNFGSIDGDNAAAMRYTEVRLTEIAEVMLEGIKQDAVDFVPSYDNKHFEPVVLPGAFPNLLANGAMGIAVGMATNIPPHNVGELCDALRYLIKKPDAKTASLLRFVQGPDFPTGGLLMATPEEIAKAYETGRGSLRVRAQWEVEKLKGGSYQIIVKELPYGVQKARLIEKIADLLNAKKLPLLGDLQDESAEDMRLVLQPRAQTVEAEVLMASLFRNCDLETRFNLNMNVVDGKGTPRVMSLQEVLSAFLMHRHDVLLRTTKHRLEQIDRRLEILDGFLIAFLNIDQVIKIIRFEDDPKASLMETFKLSDVQAEAILNMRLRALRKLEEAEIRQEHKELSDEKTSLIQLLAEPETQWQTIDAQIGDLKKRFGQKHAFGKRRTQIEHSVAEIDVPIEAVIPKESVTIICSEKGWVRALKGHISNFADIKYKDGDGPAFILQADTTQKLLVFATNGRCYTLGIDKLPSGRGFGEPIRLMVELENDEEILSLYLHTPGGDSHKRYIVGSTDGRGFMLKETDMVAQTKNGKQILSTPQNVKAAICVPVYGGMVATVGENRKLLIFKLEEIPEMSKGRGVRLQFFRDGHLSDITTFSIDDGLSWVYEQRTRTEKDILPWLGRRGQSGRMAPNGFPRNNKFSLAKTVIQLQK
jgi:topoisomerase-4 subunit A